MQNGLRNNELVPMTFEAFWAVAYGPLYTLLNLHTEGKSMGGKPFTLTKEIMKEAFSRTIKALKPWKIMDADLNTIHVFKTNITTEYPDVRLMFYAKDKLDLQ